jgi:pyrroline-5-carboxylate reductase
MRQADHTIAFIGAGNMGASLIGGLIADGYEADKIWASNHASASCDALRGLFHIPVTTDNLAAAQAADILVIAVKPGACQAVCQEIQPIVAQKKPLVLSIAAGVREAQLQQWLGGDAAIVRCMPNTPALIRTGVTGLFANALVSSHQRDLAESILRAVGMTLWVEEEAQLDAVTALSGSGPAYFFRLMESLVQAGESLGLTADQAEMLTLQTALGASKMALESTHSPAHLREQVTSPGGTTEAALAVLDAADIDQLYRNALNAAADRAKTVGDHLATAT